jgi:hypothetical protein
VSEIFLNQGVCPLAFKEALNQYPTRQSLDLRPSESDQGGRSLSGQLREIVSVTKRVTHVLVLEISRKGVEFNDARSAGSKALRRDST